MPLPPPTFADGYALTTAHEVSRTVFNGIFGDIKTRIAALQSVVVAYEAIEAAGIEASLAVITDSITPQLEALADEMTAIQALITVAEGQLLALQNAGVDAENISISDSVGLGSGLNLEEALVELQNYADGVGASVALLKLSIADKATQAHAEAGTANDVYMTPLATAFAVTALAVDVIQDVFTVSGTFTKDARDIAYYVETWGGGAGGDAQRGPSSGFFRGGVGGDYNAAVVLASSVGATVSVVVGAGGTGRISTADEGPAGTPRTAGGASSFGSHLSAGGGPLTNILYPAERSWTGGFPAMGEGTTGQRTIRGGAAGGSADYNFTTIAAGSTVSGGAGGAASASDAGTAGTAPGGGGGAAVRSGANAVGGDGARGEVRVTRFRRKA